MNCRRCAQVLAPGVQVCPYCGEPVYAQPSANVYQQSYAQYQTGNYPMGYQPAYTYGQTMGREENGFLTTLSELPRTFLRSFTEPGEVLRTMVEKHDRFSCPIVAGLVLLLTFLCGMLMMRGLVGTILSALSAVTGMSLASTSASMNQGVSYIAGRIAPMAGGIAVLCQALAMLIPAAVFMVYICAIRHVSFSWALFFGFATVTSLPTVAVSLLAMALSLLTPWAALLVIACGMALSLTQACGMLGLITARQERELFLGKLICAALSVLLSLAVAAVVGGLLMGGVMERMLILLGNLGSLI